LFGEVLCLPLSFSYWACCRVQDLHDVLQRDKGTFFVRNGWKSTPYLVVSPNMIKWQFIGCFLFFYIDFDLLISKVANWLIITFNIDFKKELRSFNRELQLHILDLAERPSQYARRVEDISLIFKNLHHFLNSLRPHQVKCFWGIIHTLFGFYLRVKFIVQMAFPHRLGPL
jgi:hypothetical protein